MGIRFQQLKELEGILKPYIEKCNKKEITQEEYGKIRDEKYREFIEKYS